MEIKDLKINDEVSVKVSTQRLRDTEDEKWIYEPIFEMAKVVEVDKDGLFASIVFIDGKWGELDKDTEWYPIPSSTKIATHERPSHYGSSDIDLIDYWCMRYTPEELRGAFKSQMSKYVDRLGHKDDVVNELNKIIDYAERYKNHLEKVKALMTDKPKAKSYLKQYFGTKRYLYQDGRKVAHMHIVNGVYLLHGHFKTKFSRFKLEFKCEQEFNNYIEKHELHFEV